MGSQLPGLADGGPPTSQQQESELLSFFPPVPGWHQPLPQLSSVLTASLS